MRHVKIDVDGFVIERDIPDDFQFVLQDNGSSGFKVEAKPEGTNPLQAMAARMAARQERQDRAAAAAAQSPTEVTPAPGPSMSVLPLDE